MLRTGKKLTDEEAALEVERILESSRKQNKFLTEGEALPHEFARIGYEDFRSAGDWRARCERHS